VQFSTLRLVAAVHDAISPDSTISIASIAIPGDEPMEAESDTSPDEEAAHASRSFLQIAALLTTPSARQLVN
jgi:hypothetical protein